MAAVMAVEMLAEDEAGVVEAIEGLAVGATVEETEETACACCCRARCMRPIVGCIEVKISCVHRNSRKRSKGEEKRVNSVCFCLCILEIVDVTRPRQ